MLPLEAVSFLLLLGGTCGAYAAGRGAAGRFQWLRRGALVVLAGGLIAVQVHLILTGFVASPVGYAAGAVALSGVFSLMGIDLVRDELAKPPRA